MSDNIKTLNSVERCPHCGTGSPFLGQTWQGFTVGSKYPNRRLWGAFICTSCGGLVTACTDGEYERNLLDFPDEVFPRPKYADEDLPPIARSFLQQAMDTIHAPDAAAVMAGSAVDAMLKEKGLRKGSLYERIDSALGQNILTQGMADWAHEVRLGSNRPRHADEANPHVTSEQAQQSVDFAEALGNFLFVLTAKIERGIQAALEEKP